MRKIILIFPLFLLGCSYFQPPIQATKLMGEAQGTYYSITYFDENSRDLQQEIDSLLDEFDMSVSLWVPNSILSRVNNNDSSLYSFVIVL